MCKSGVEWPIGIGPPTKGEVYNALVLSTALCIFGEAGWA